MRGEIRSARFRRSIRGEGILEEDVYRGAGPLKGVAGSGQQIKIWRYQRKERKF